MGSESSTISFFVPGIAKPAGSKRGFVLQRPGQKPRAIITDDCKTSRDWKSDVKTFAMKAMIGKLMLTGPILATFTFTMPRPKSHYRSGKYANELREGAPYWHMSKPDVLKLSRAVEDALTGIVYADDSQIAVEHLIKAYGTNPGVEVLIESI